MNGVSLQGEEAKNERAVAKFVRSANKVSGAIDLVERHRIDMAKKRMTLLQLPDDALVIDLLLKSNGQELQQLKTEAFFELLATRANLSVDKVKSLHEELMG